MSCAAASTPRPTPSSPPPGGIWCGGTLYLVGRDARTGELLSDATSCSMCRRLVINAGLSQVVIRRTAAEFDVVDVADWVAEDDLLAPPEEATDRG